MTKVIHVFEKLVTGATSQVVQDGDIIRSKLGDEIRFEVSNPELQKELRLFLERQIPTVQKSDVDLWENWLLDAASDSISEILRSFQARPVRRYCDWLGVGEVH